MFIHTVYPSSGGPSSQMAASGDYLAKVKENLTCPLCFEQYNSDGRTPKDVDRKDDDNDDDDDGNGGGDDDGDDNHGDDD